MRVIAGTARGRRLEAPRGSRTRPTADRVREALFSALARLLDGARVLDLYAGSGALGIEALSRGAGHATLVEQDARTARLIRRNLAAADVADRADVVTADAGRWAASYSGMPFDLVLADPPYAQPLGPLLDLVAGLPLTAGATVVVERDRRGDDTPGVPEGLEHVRDRRYGDTVLRTYVVFRR